MANFLDIGLCPSPATWGKTNHIQWLSLLAPPQLLHGTVVDPTRVLGGHKALQVERVVSLHGRTILRLLRADRGRPCTRAGSKPPRAKAPPHSEGRPAHENPSWL